MELLLLRQLLGLLDFCTRLRICLEVLFFATFLLVKLWNKYCLLLCSECKIWAIDSQLLCDFSVFPRLSVALGFFSVSYFLLYHKTEGLHP